MREQFSPERIGAARELVATGELLRRDRHRAPAHRRGGFRGGLPSTCIPGGRPEVIGPGGGPMSFRCPPVCIAVLASAVSTTTKGHHEQDSHRALQYAGGCRG